MKAGHLLMAAALAVLVSCGKQAAGPAPAADQTAAPESSPSAPAEIVTASGVVMISLPGGEFKMGSNTGNPDEAPEHNVKLTGFLIDKYEVTQVMLAKVQLPNPSHWNENPKKPVERVRWRDAKQYC